MTVRFSPLSFSPLSKVNLMRLSADRAKYDAYHTYIYVLTLPWVALLMAFGSKVVLSIQSFKRGLPMIPCTSHPLVSIDAGARMGLPHWRRYKTQEQNARNESAVGCWLQIGFCSGFRT